ncbi:MAG: FAD-dependent monooxygenase [Nitrospinae bacterium]|nr:FAD-dependent monooxygenase [Nitrospinota bacterium]MBI3814603.1 FAD-dependent monooxygenase [Nitrospinota bacterium]
MDKFDCIIVGAGPAGVAAAITLIRKGLTVAIFERGEYPGSKNVFGGVLYSTVLNKLTPEFWKDAPVERHITKRRYSILSKNSEMAVEFDFEDFNQPPFNNSFTILRAKFDRWFAQRAEDSGAVIFTETVVDDFIYDSGKVAGVRARREGGDVYADVVICAEGANSLLTEKAGLKKKPLFHQMITAVKEVVSLPREVIEDRFILSNDEGVALEFFGEAVKGMIGSGFIYTNKDSLSVGVGCPIDVMKENSMKPNDLLESFKSHPVVKKLLRGGKTEELSAKMIPELGYKSLPKLIADGLLIVGDAAGFVNPSLYREGTNMAMYSGIMAAETILEAKEKGDFSEKSLQGYVKRLKNSFVMKDLERYGDVPEKLSEMPQLFKEYPDAILKMVQGYFTISDLSKDEMHRQAWNGFKDEVSLWKFLWDMYKARKAIL